MSLTGSQTAWLLFRQGHLGGITVADLAREPLLLAEDARAPEFNQFTVEMCRAAGYTPTVYRGTVESIRAAADPGGNRRRRAARQRSRISWTGSPGPTRTAT
jgi:hypothetical protein